jgi:hypothetical protein
VITFGRKSCSNKTDNNPRWAIPNSAPPDRHSALFPKL